MRRSNWVEVLWRDDTAVTQNGRTGRLILPVFSDISLLGNTCAINEYAELRDPLGLSITKGLYHVQDGGATLLADLSNLPGLNANEQVGGIWKTLFKGSYSLIYGYISDSSLNSIANAIWLNHNGTTQLVVRSDALLYPGFSVTGIRAPSLNAQGQIIAQVWLMDPSFPYRTYQVVYSNFTGPFVPLFRPGDPLPEAGANFSVYPNDLGVSFYADPAVANDDGSFYMVVVIRDGSRPPDDSALPSLWRLTPSSRTLMLRGGQRPPGASDDVTISRSNFRLLQVNPDGKYLLNVELLPPNPPVSQHTYPKALLSNAYGAATIVAREGQLVPGTDQTLERFGTRDLPPAEAQMNSLGQILIPAFLRSPPTPDFPDGKLRSDVPVRLDRNGNMRIAIREGVRAPGDGELITLLGIAVPFGQALSDRGEIVFTAVPLVFTSNPQMVVAVSTIVDEPRACRADYDHNGSLSLEDLFSFLRDWFSNNADFNQDGTTTLGDLFDFLAAWFSGC